MLKIIKASKKLTAVSSALLFLGLFSLNSIGSLWGPVKISSDLISTNPQVKTDPDGNAVVTWAECDGENSSIQTKTFNGEESWSIPMTVSRFAANFTENGHKLTIDPAGNAVAIWPEQIDSLHTVIRSSILPFKASKWMPSVTLSDPITLNKTPELSLGFSGAGMAAWADELGFIQFVPFTNGRWVLPAMDFLPSNDGSNPKMAVDSSGNTIIVWEEIIDGEISIMGARLPFGKKQWISSNAPLSAPNASSPQVAINTDNDASAVWVNEFNIIQYSTLKSGTDDWSSPPHNLSEISFISSQPQIVIDLDSTITTIWKAENSEGSIIQSAVRPFDREWLQAVNVSDLHGNASDPQLAVDQLGNVVAAWRNIISDNNVVIQFSRLSEEGIWSKPVDLSKEGEKAGLPQISTLNNDNVIVVWPNETLGIIEAVLVPPLDPRIAETQNVLQAQVPPPAPSPAPLVVPVVTGVSPICGTPGTLVTLTGTGFTGVTAVTFGALPAASFTFISDTSISAVAPNGTIGLSVNVTVTNPSGTSGTSPSARFTYINGLVPSITSVSPPSGLPAGGNTVTITGSNFLGANSVKFGAISSPIFTIINSTQITAQVPAGTACTTVDVTVGNCIGTSNPLPYSYLPPLPTVTGLSPTSGTPLGGTSVVITGTNFFGVSGASAVKFGTSNAASYTVDSSTQITAFAPVANACQVNVTVTNCTGTSATSAANLYTYTLGAPTVTNLSVASGSPAGGTSVNITGTNFYNVPGVTTVLFGGVPATSFTVNSTTSITAVSPAATVCGIVDVTVTTCDGTSAITNADKFTYMAPLPTVTGISPDSGPITGGTSVVITGNNFYNVIGTTAVSFGGIPAASFTVDNPSQITAISPVGMLSCDPVDITVTTCSGTSIETAADQFTFIAVPTITGLSVSSGTAAGGTTVVITGTNFFPSPGTSVSFGSTPATSITVDSSTQITVTSPPGALTCVPINVTVTTCQGTSPITSADEFTYTAGAVPANPSITLITPSSGPQAGGTSVTISGTNLFTPTSVTFGGIPSTSFSANSAGTLVTAVSPAGVPSCSPVDIVVTNCQGSSAIVPADQFTYIKPLPTVTFVAPVSGPPSGGTAVVITGANYYSQSQVTAVTFGGVPASSYIVNSPTQITAISPPGVLTCAIVDINVTTCNGGTSISTGVNDNFVYTTPPPTVTAISPSSGTPAGGTLVTISGTDLYQVATVYFGNSPATIVTTDPNGMFIEALSPGGPVSCVPVEISVVTCEGTSSPTIADFYTYAITPTVTGVSPSNGPLAGGTSVTISGTDFYDITGVFFGGVPALDFDVDNLGQITAIAPPNANCGPVNITVSNCGATSPITPDDVYLYGPTGVATVTNVFPTSGSAGGGTSVTITGTNFIGTTAVEFGGIAAQSYVVDSNTQITAIAPAGTPCSSVDVSVTNCGISTIFNGNQFSYTVIPTITGLSAIAGPCAGGTTVIITGTEFYDVTSVTFAGVSASFTVNSPTQITAITPPNIACDCTPIDVRVTTCAGTSPITLADKFIYTNFIGNITGIVPPSGPPEGGTAVTITGTGFSGNPTVYFGSNPATSVVVVNSTTITAVTPAGTACTTVPVVVLQCDTSTGSPGGGSASFTYVAGVPSVSLVSPNTGSLTGGTIVTITGTGFYAPATVHFGTNAATNVIINSTTQITATAPAGFACETVHVTVTTCGGTSPETVADEFTYSTPSGVTITGITPSFGDPSGGTSVIITGTNFYGLSGPSAVKFGTVNAASYVVNSPTQITAVSPAATNACSVHITVTACSTTSIPTPDDLFTYAISGGAPIVQELTVASGLPTGGTSLIIIGKNFYNVVGTTSVMFGAVPATSFTVNSPTSISVISPPGVLCTQVDVTVTTCQGTSAISPDDVFIYTAPPPYVATINPMSGPLAGGTMVTITGTDFYDIPPTGAVLFGSIPSASYTVDSLTQITAEAPPGVLTCEPVYVTVTNCIGTSPNLNTDMFTYTVPAPTITGIAPALGTPAGGTPVIITGTDFYNVPGHTEVTFGGIPAASFTVDSLTQITAITPPGPLTCSPIDVEVTVCASALSPVQFEYTAPVPDITGVSPISGPLAGGNTVTITGTDFFTITGVSFGGIPATSYSVISPMEIQAVAPAGVPSCSPINITVTNCEGTSSISLADQYKYNLNPPTITKISPTTGALAGGTLVTITGTNFYNIPPNLPPDLQVTFGGVPATSVTVVSPTQITAVSPPGTLTCTAVDVAVKICGVTSPNTTSDNFIYTSLPPSISSISPSVGSPLGGTTVVITGSNFFNVQTVRFGSNLATIVSTDPTGNTITVTSPAGLLTCTPVHVSVTTCEGTSAPTANDFFTYTAPPPSITPPLNPVSGSPSGGTAVIITGNDFFNITSVKFGSVNATSFVVNSPTQITAFSPAGAACTTVQLTVTNCLGTSNSSPFLYLPLAPLVTSISPTSGVTAGGNTVTITGLNFLGANQPGGQVLFGATPASSFTVVNNTTITAVAPAGTNCSVVDITVVTCAGSSTLPNAYTYRTTPTIGPSLISPTTGPAGTVVTINGTNFTGTTDVTFGITPATSFTFISNTQLTAVVPSMGLTNCQQVDIRVTTCAGTSAIVTADRFSYQTTPVIPVTISSISPSFGPVGTLVTITGTGFTGTTGVTGVRFGAVNATSYTVVNDTTITAVAPNGTNCSRVSITVQNCVGTATLPNAFQYQTPPTVTAVTPNNAPVGTLVTITGTNFTGATAVTFGVTNAAPFTIVNNTTITVNVPVIAGATNCQVFDVRVTTCAGTSAINIPNDQFTYQTLGVPIVNLLSVNTGSPTGGTTVIIGGSNFTGVSSVKFGTASATIVNATNTSIEVLSPAGTPCSSVPVTVTTCVGTSDLPSAPLFTYDVGVPAPTVSSLAPAVGPPSGGTVVTITGSNFYAPATVTFDGIPATSVAVNNSTQITATAPEGVACKPVQVTVTTCGGTSAPSAGSTFTYNVSVTAPSVSGLSPAGGTTAGGTPVSIQGNNFTGVTEVFFGGISVPFTFISNMLISATSPAGINCSIVDVTVKTCGGTSPITPADKFTYNQNPPVVTGLSPAVGPAAGGTTVTISGNHFTGVTSVQFGGVPAVIVNSTDTTINVTSPIGVSCSAVHVIVTTCAGPSATSPVDVFTYNVGVPTPVVTSLTPAVGAPGVGTPIIINGTGFTGVTTVHFGATSVPFVFNNDSSISITSLPGATCSSVHITVTTCGGTSATSSNDLFTFSAGVSAPIVGSISPTTGPVGTPVTITGSGFTGASSVHFGTTSATPFTIVNDTTITTTAPNASDCTVNVTVTNCVGTSAPSATFTYTGLPAPHIISLNPNFGPSGGFNTVNIVGTGFVGNESNVVVSFGGTPATIVSITPTLITVTAPPAPPAVCNLTVTVTGCNGTSNAVEYFYIYPPPLQRSLAAPVVTSVTPNHGPVAGGNTVTIAGMNLIDVSAIMFGAYNSPSFTPTSTTQLDNVVVPPSDDSSCVVNVVVVTCTEGNSDPVPYTYDYPLPVVTNVSPNSGSPSGGNTITLTGTNFIGITAVHFGTVNAPIFTPISPTSISVQVPPAGVDLACVVDITVTGCAGTSVPTPTDRYTYNFPAPTITNVNPNIGPTAGGNQVVITGTNFVGLTSVVFGANPATIVSATQTQIIVTAPPGALGTVTITATFTSGGCNGTAIAQYTYQNAPFPPPSFTGCIKKNKFLNGTRCVLEATWSPSPSPNVVSYKIYKNNQVVAQIPATSPRFFQQPLPDCTANGYSITAVNNMGLESPHVPLQITQ